MSKQEAAQRVLDLRIYSPRPKEPPIVRRNNGRWVATLRRYGRYKGRLYIRIDSGEMWVEE